MKTFFEQLRNFWGQLDANQKVSLGLASMLVIAGMVALLFWSQRPQMRMLYGSLAEKDAAAIVGHLESQGIPYEIRGAGNAVYVPADQVYRARMDVVSEGLVTGDSVGFEIFDKTSFGVSDFIQRTNFIRAVQGELARTIAQLRGVHGARVMVVIPDNRLLLVNNNVETTASVFVDVGGGSINQQAVQSIQSLVANAVEGLSTDNVAVVDNHGNVLSVERNADSMLAASAGVMEYRQMMETYFAEKVESMLERVVGRGNAVVRVAADIDEEQVSKMEERFDETSAVIRSQRTEEETRSSESVDRFGGAANVMLEDAELATNAGTPTRTEEDRRNRDQQFEIDRTVTNVVRGPGAIRRLTASVFVAAKAAADAPAEALERDTAEMEQLRTMVANALGIDLQNSDTGDVTVTEMVFAADPFISAGGAAMAGTVDIAQWLQFGEEILGTVIALVLFIVFFQMYRKARSQPNPFDQLARHQGNGSRGNTFGNTNVTPELLNDLIRQKPDNAAMTLRNWLSGKGSND
jgi:flagellar M-ring protein FliF